jgi:hypothetical protein
MIELNKYYTPEIEEFRVGFECQFLSYRYDDPSWIDYVIKEYDFKKDRELLKDCFALSIIGYNLNEFIQINSQYIKPLTESNDLNRNIENGVTEKNTAKIIIGIGLMILGIFSKDSD